jgi:colicin import membrane protein
LSEQPQKSGLVVSGALHGALLAAIVIGFTGAPKFDDAAESIPVETITQNQFNEVMKGEREAKPAKPVETPAPPIETPKPPEQAQSAPPAPPPPQRPEEPKPTPPAATPTPPERPAAPMKEAAAPPTPPPPPDAEVDRPQARPDPQPPPTPPAPPARPKAEKPKPDQLAKLLDEPKPNEPAKPPKPRTETQNDRRFDPNSIAKLLGQGKPRNIEQVASATPLGSPTQNAQRLSPSLAAAIDGWLTDAYLRCWQPPPTMPDGAKYVAEIRVAFNPDGSLSAHPLLINPPPDPAWRAYADSAMRAVLRCNPLQVPPQYAPYFEQWRTKTVHFDPENALG